MTCSLCKGTGNLLAWDGKPELWTCPKCGGCGAQIQYGPAFVGPRSKLAVLARAAG